MTKAEIIEYLKSHELDVQSGRASFIMCDLAYGAYTKAYQEFGKDFGPWFAKYSSKGKKDASFGFSQFCSKETIAEISDWLLEDYLRRPKSLLERIENHNQLGRRAEKVWKNYKNLKNKKRENLVNYFEKYSLETEKWWKYAIFGEEKGEIINRKIVPTFCDKYGWDIDEARRVIAALSHPDREMIFTKARKEFLELCLIIKDSPKKFDKKAGDYLENYFWMKSDFYEARDYTKNILLKEIKEELKKGKREIQKEIKEIEENFRAIKREEEELRKKYVFDSGDEKLISFSKLISLWMDDRKIWMMRQVCYFYRFLEGLAKEFHLSYLDLSFYTPEESLKLKSGFRVSLQEISQRKRKVFVCKHFKSPLQIFYGNDAKSMIEAADSSEKGNLKGIVASRGKSKLFSGKARIIENPIGQFFEKGDILVTSMTRVEFVPLMKKASAIITDEGGMVCHAAIVSRELGIPAIIGTKHAMRTLKDGDEIEMNMETGEIRKIN